MLRIKTFSLLIVPGAAEALKSDANRKSNLAWHGIANGAQIYRDTIYASVLIGGLAIFEKSPVLAVTSIGGIVFGSVRLYDLTKYFHEKKD